MIRVNGRRPRKNDHRRCTTPEQEDTETQPLSMLLPAQRGDYEFKPAGMDRIDNRPAIRLDFRLLTKVTVETSMVEGVDDCISYDVNGGRRGRLWIDAETFDVLRIDERLAGLVEVPLPREAARHPGAQRFWTARALGQHDALQAPHLRRPRGDAGAAGVVDDDDHHARLRHPAPAHGDGVQVLQALPHRRTGGAGSPTGLAAHWHFGRRLAASGWRLDLKPSRYAMLGPLANETGGMDCSTPPACDDRIVGSSSPSP